MHESSGSRDWAGQEYVDWLEAFFPADSGDRRGGDSSDGGTRDFQRVCRIDFNSIYNIISKLTKMDGAVKLTAWLIKYVTITQKRIFTLFSISIPGPV